MPFLVTRDAVRLHYETVGSGPPLVLQTGGAGDGSMWRDAGYVEELSTVCRCILFDHRGHGMSDQPPKTDAHTMARYVDDVVALLDHLELEQSAFWGYSQGAAIGLATAASRPQHLSALITTGVIGNPDREIDASEMVEAAKQLRRVGWNSIVDPQTDIPSWFRRQIENTNAEMLAQWFQANIEFDEWAQFPDIGAPVLMFVGELEDPHDWNGLAASKMPNARVIRMGGLDHLTAFIRSNLILPYAVEFLRSSVSLPQM